MKKLIVASMIIPLLAACAGKSPEDITAWDYKKNPDYSEGRNIAVAVDLDIPESVRLSSDLEAGAYVASKNIIGTANVVSGLGGILLKPSSRPLYTMRHIYVFLPKDQAGTGDDAEKLLNNMVTSAILKALQKQGLKMGKAPAFIGDTEIDVVIGKGCTTTKVICPVGAGSFNYNPIYIMNNSAMAGGALLEKTPYFVGGGPAWFFKGYLPLHAVRSEAHREGMLDTGKTTLAAAGIDEAKLYRDLTSALPEWVYAYTPTGEGGQPTIYNAGKALP